MNYQDMLPKEMLINKDIKDNWILKMILMLKRHKSIQT